MGLIFIAAIIYLTFFFTNRRKLIAVETHLNELNEAIIENIDKLIALVQEYANEYQVTSLDNELAQLAIDRSKIKRNKARYFTTLESELYGLIITLESNLMNLEDASSTLNSNSFSEQKEHIKYIINSTKDEYNPMVDDYYSMMVAQMVVSMLRGQKHFEHWIKIEPTSKRYF